MVMYNLRVPKTVSVNTLTVNRKLTYNVPSEYLGYYDLYPGYGYYEYGDSSAPKIVFDEEGAHFDIPIKSNNIYEAVQYKAENGDLYNTYVDNAGAMHLVKI